VSDEREPDEDLRDSERRLLGLLALLQTDGGQGDPALTGAVMRAVRWQAAVREAARTVGAFAGSAAESVTVLFGLRRGERPPDGGGEGG
jgi:hypothetical protein